MNKVIAFAAKRNIRRFLQNIGMALGGLLLLYQGFRAVQAFVESRIQIDAPVYLLLSVVIIFITIALQMLAWSVLMGNFGVNIPWGPLKRGYILSFLPRYIPGTVWGYISRGEWLSRDYQVNHFTAHASSLLEVFVAVFSSVLVILIYSAFLLQGPQRILFLLIIALIVLFAWFLVQRVYSWPIVTRRFSNQGKAVNIRLSSWLVIVGLITFNMFLYGTALYLTFHALNIAPGGVHFPQYLTLFSALFSASWLIGFLLFIFPSGLGLREITLSGLLVANLALHMDVASAVSILFRLIVTVAELSWIVLVGWRLITKKIKPDYSPDS